MAWCNCGGIPQAMKKHLKAPRRKDQLTAATAAQAIKNKKQQSTCAVWHPPSNAKASKCTRK